MKKKKKMKSLLVSLLFLIVLIGAYAGITVYNNRATEAETETESTGAVMLSMTQEDITELSIQGEEGVMHFVKKDGTWISTEQPDLSITQTYLNNMARTFSDLTAVRTIRETTDNLAEYGLDVPKYQATATDGNGNTQTLYIGNQATTGDYYAYVEGMNGVYTIKSAQAGFFKHNLYAMASASTSFPTVAADAFVRVTLTDGDMVTEIKRLEDSLYDPSNLNVWFLTKPFPHEYPASNGALSNSESGEGLFDRLSSLAYSGIVANNPSEEELTNFGLSNSTKTLSFDYTMTEEQDQTNTDETASSEETTTVQTREESFEMTIGGIDDTNGYYYVMPKGGNQVFKMPSSTLDAIFSAEPSSYIYRYFSVVNIASVDSIEVKNADSVYELGVRAETSTDESGTERKEYIYQYQQEELSEEKQDTASKLFSDLISIAAERIEMEPKETNGPIDFSITYHRNEAPETFEVTFSDYNTNYYLANANGDAIYLVNRRDLDEYRNRIVETLKSLSEKKSDTQN